VEALGLEIPETVDVNRDIALQLGVPARDIVILEAGADSTWDEALAVKDFLERQGKESVVLVTSRYHSTRAKKTFEKVLGGGYKVISCPSRYDPFDPEEWWKHRRPQDLFHEARILDRYYMESRYPNGFPEGSPQDFFDEKIAEEAYNAAGKIIGFCENIIGRF